MKRFILASSMFLSLPVCASSSNINLGSSMTTGPVSNGYSMAAASNNPAAAPLIMPKGEKWRTSYIIPTFGINFEYGQVDNYETEIEDLIDILDDPSLSSDSEQTRQRFNEVLRDIGENGYVRSSFGLHAPMLPAYYQSETLGGTIGVDLSVIATGSFSILDDELYFNDVKRNFATATSIYLKSGIESSLSLSYGREILSNDMGTLYGGAKLKVIYMELSKQLLPLETLDSDEIEDLIGDRYDTNLERTTDYAVDLGLVWDAHWYQVGLTLENINEPEFEYGDVGENCELLAEGSDVRTSCEYARTFTQEQGRIAASEVHTKYAMARADVLIKPTQQLILSASADLAEYNDVVGFEHQWYHLAIAYQSDFYWIRSARLGYQENLAGTKTSSVNAGLTLMDTLNIDVQWGLDTVTIDNQDAPRTFGFSVSFQQHF